MWCQRTSSVVISVIVKRLWVVVQWLRLVCRIHALLARKSQLSLQSCTCMLPAYLKTCRIRIPSIICGFSIDKHDIPPIIYFHHQLIFLSYIWDLNPSLWLILTSERFLFCEKFQKWFFLSCEKRSTKCSKQCSKASLNSESVVILCIWKF